MDIHGGKEWSSRAGWLFLVVRNAGRMISTVKSLVPRDDLHRTGWHDNQVQGGGRHDFVQNLESGEALSNRRDRGPGGEGGFRGCRADGKPSTEKRPIPASWNCG